MEANFETMYRDVRDWAHRHGIHVVKRRLAPGKAGTFKGISIAMNSAYDADETLFYLVHALGSIVRWSLTREDVQAMFEELRTAKKTDEPTRLEHAINHYRAFESESSEFAVWLLADLGHADVVPSYTNFMRADLEALTVFHRTRKAPVWSDFFARWNDDVAAGRRQVDAFRSKPIPEFVPQEIENQEILQQQGPA